MGVRRGAAERFERLVVPSGDGCCMWVGSMAGRYGKFKLDGRDEGAHRAAWRIYVGPIPRGMCVLHRCDEPLCVRVDHLFLGTQADNIADRDAKGRRNIAAAPRKLDEARVAALVAMSRCGATGRFLAAAFGVSPGTVSAILSGRQWAHATGGMLDARG